MTLKEGGTTDVGVVKLKIHGVNGVRRGHRRRRPGQGAEAPRPDYLRTAAGRAGVEAGV